MKKLIVIMLLMGATVTANAEKVVYKLVWPNGYVMGIEFTNITMCQLQLRSAPSGSNCVAVIK